ncbi:MAG: efflux RND transporter periplasmic adaptor subunit [Acidobacteria bacterium]|nr:efflux RND transporter periplasmic adaptor subunit [Acidobacteriota bacterium]
MQAKNKFLSLVSVTLIASMTACNKTTPSPSAATIAATAPAVPNIAVTKVVAQELSRNLRLPGELQPYQDVQLYPKVQGFVEWIGVDRGSEVKAGQILVRLTAPEFAAQRGEAEAKTQVSTAQKIEAESRLAGLRAQRLEAEAKLAASTATHKRLKSAAATPGVISGNELENAQHLMEADQARVQFFKDSEKSLQAQINALAEGEKAVRAAVRTVQVNQSYLQIAAPFAGVITERNAHPGTFAGPSGGTAQPILRLQQITRLRLIVNVPEAELAGIAKGTRVEFSVPAFPGETFAGAIARIGNSLDPKTRTMPIELDVSNTAKKLAPGMFPQITWPTQRPRPSLFVPPSAIATTTERAFVIRIRDNIAEWVDVKRGASINQQGTDLVEIFGELSEGDQIALRGTDELRAGTRVQAKLAAAK